MAAVFERADRLLEGLLVGLADAHHLADGAHLRAELVYRALEFLEGPAGELHDDIVAGGGVFLQGPVAPVGDFVERETAGEFGRNERDGKAGGLGGKGRGARGARVDLDDDDAARLRIVGKLDVGPADHPDRLDDPVGIVLEPRLQLRVDRQHGGDAVGVAGMHAHGIHVFDEADGDHLVFGVADDFQLQFLPAEHRFLDEDLADHAGGQAAAGDHAELLDVVDETAARAAHGVGRSNDDGIADFGGDLFGLLDAERRCALRHVDPQPLHGFLEDDAVLALFDRVGFDADDADAVFGKHARLGELRGEVEAGLTAQVRQEGVGPFLLDDLRQGLHRQRLDVGGIRHAGVGHDGGRVGVDQHDLVAEAAQGLAGLGAGIIEFAGLSDDDGTGADDQYFLDVVASGHRGFPLCF